MKIVYISVRSVQVQLMGVLNILLTVVGAFVFGFMAMYYSGQSVNAVSLPTSISVNPFSQFKLQSQFSFFQYSKFSQLQSQSPLYPDSNFNLSYPIFNGVAQCVLWTISQCSLSLPTSISVTQKVHLS